MNKRHKIRYYSRVKSKPRASEEINCTPCTTTTKPEWELFLLYFLSWKELYHSGGFTFVFKSARELVSPSWISLKCFTVYLSWAQKNTIKVLSPPLFYLALLLLQRNFGGKIPLETSGFGYTLLNLPQTFVKELKGIN